MKLLKALFAFYINSSIHVALAVTALVGVTQLYAALPLNWPFYAFIFFGTITGYNFVKYAEVAGLHHRSLARDLKTIQVFSVFCALCLVLVSLQMEMDVILYTAGFGVLTFFYAVPIAIGLNLRSVGGIKIFIVAIVWAGVTVIVPVVAAHEMLSNSIWLLLLQRFLLVVVWVLPFEIRDVKYDILSLGTIPQRVGINRTKVIGFLLLFIALFCEFSISEGISWKISAAILTMVLSGYFILKAKKIQGEYYASFWVESVPIWWFLLAYFFFNCSL